MAVTRECDDLDKEIESLVQDGYRLDMIMPADAPREVQLSKNGEVVRLLSEPVDANLRPPATTGGSDGWRVGRAGMMYRDLMPDRIGGWMAVSHIRLTEGGENFFALYVPVADSWRVFDSSKYPPQEIARYTEKSGPLVFNHQIWNLIKR